MSVFTKNDRPYDITEFAIMTFDDFYHIVQSVFEIANQVSEFYIDSDCDISLMMDTNRTHRFLITSNSYKTAEQLSLLDEPFGFDEEQWKIFQDRLALELL